MNYVRCYINFMDMNTIARRIRLSVWCLVWAGSWALLYGAPDELGFKSLFNGKDLSGWDGNPAFWSAKDGMITGETTPTNPTKGNTFLIWREGTLDDFELRFSYKIVGNNPEKFGNSGVQYRSKDLGNYVVGGYQADIECGPTFTGILYEERGRGVLANRGEKTIVGNDGKVKVIGSVGNAKELQAAIKNEEWNDYVILAVGNHLIHRINGQVMVDVTDEQTSKRARSGILALQLHAGSPMTVRFKEIRLKRFPLTEVKKIVMVAGRPSHGPADHEHNAGVLLLKKCLDDQPEVLVSTYLNGWPKDPTAFDNADTIMLFMDGGSGHAMILSNHLEQIGDRMKQGVGLACIHYAVEVPKDKGGPEMLKWIGGYYETGYSINPTWDANITFQPNHPIWQGVKPWKLRDEWYYGMRFDPEHPVTPILKATPPDNTRTTPETKSHPGREEILAWAFERPDGGRGFGFTGGHFHKNWMDENFRKIVLNALVWTAKLEVPTNGVESVVTEEDQKWNLDPKGNQKTIPAPWSK
jgi:type 1 glutamine amidotransferase